MDVTGNVDFKDFEEREDPWPFRVGTQMYEAVPAIGVTTLAELSKMQGAFSVLNTKLADDALDLGEFVGALQGVFSKILVPDSAQRFNARLVDPVKPVSMKTLVGVIAWLMECYGMRPTQPSAPSSSALADDASTSSTPGQPSTVVVTGPDSPRIEP